MRSLWNREKCRRGECVAALCGLRGHCEAAVWLFCVLNVISTQRYERTDGMLRLEGCRYDVMRQSV